MNAENTALPSLDALRALESRIHAATSEVFEIGLYGN